MIDELSLHLSAYARSRPNMGQGQRVGRARPDVRHALVGTSPSAALACLIGITLAAPEAIPRRDNVAATIAILQARLSKTELPTSTGIGSVPVQLLQPA